MRTLIFFVITLALFFAGCDNQGGELEKRNNELMQELAAKDRFIDEITSTINDINNKIETTWAMEKSIMRHATSVEGTKTLSQAELKQKMLDRISDISSTLTENRKKVGQLQQKLKAAGSQYTGLQQMVEDLKKNLEEREKSIAEFQTRVQNLESQVGQKAQVIAAHETTIENQTKQLNTVYYVVGNRDELKEKGIISDEGGFLWGLIGSTTVLASNFDGEHFQSTDKRSDTMIEVPARIDELVPKRDESSYAKVESENGHTVLRIVKPDYFWKNQRLVIVTE